MARPRGVLRAAAVCALGLVGAIGAWAGTAGAASSEPIKAAWIYVGPHNDGGWSQAHDAGRLYVQKMLGSKVQTTYKENVPEGPQVSQVIESLIRDGNKIIFGTSFGYQNAMAAEAQKHQDVDFEQATGTKLGKNLAQYYGAGEDGIYLSGIAAGAASKTGKIGYVVPFAIPEVIRHTNAFTLGAQAANPKATVKVIWTNSWFAPDKEKKAAENLHTSGVDVIGQNVDSPSAGQYAESQGLPWVGYDSNAKKFAPKSWLTAATYNWGPYYLKRVRAAMNGTWSSGFYYGSLKDGFVQLAPYGPKVSAKTKALIAAKKAAIESGKFNPFTGPITDQGGKVVIAKGKTPTVQDLYAQTFFVKGVIGSPKG
jgi:basic membrane lipoprotein Med (substrate-binding protein (PBP1-ABC) superfamily)